MLPVPESAMTRRRFFASTTSEPKKIEGQQWVELTPDFLGESRHEFVARLAYEHGKRRGMPLGSPEIDWFEAERTLYESLVASGAISPLDSNPEDMAQVLYG